MRERLLAWVKRSIMEIILFVLCAILAFEAEGFFSVDNLLNVLRNVSMQGIIAFGMTMVIISGEIDLSVGSAVAFCRLPDRLCDAALGRGWAGNRIGRARSHASGLASRPKRRWP